MRISLGLFFALLLTLASVGVAWAQDGPNFASTCNFSEESTNDPIVEAMAGHLHDYAGVHNVTNADTSDTLRTRGTTECDRKQNLSSYWLPPPKSDGVRLGLYTGRRLGDFVIYYRDGKITDQRTVGPIPRGLEMIARDGTNTGDVKWGCEGGKLLQAPPASCSNKLLMERIEFGQCWDGDYVPDSANQPESVVVAVNGRCPADHPITMTQLTIRATWKLTSTRVGAITVAGDTPSGPGWVSYDHAHADFMDGWLHDGMTAEAFRPTLTMEQLTRDCINTVGDTQKTADKPSYCRDPGPNG